MTLSEPILSQDGEVVVPLSLEDTRQLTDIAVIRQHVKALNLNEQHVDHQLDILMKEGERLEECMATLLRLNPSFQILHTDAQQLASTVTFTSQLADNVSVKVRGLDTAMTNVQRTTKMVEAIIDLQATVEGVEDALARGDYTEAANHVHHYLSFDSFLLADPQTLSQSGDAKREAMASRLARATDQLTAVINTKMDEAIRKENMDEIYRYFKLFPLINADNMGLRKYTQYMCAQVGARAQEYLKDTLRKGSDASKMGFVQLITRLVEDVAGCVEEFAPTINTIYGQGRSLLILQTLQKECDRQAGAILEAFTNERRIHKLVADINQSLHNRPFPSQRDLMVVNSQREEPAGPDPRDLDSILWEVATISNRVEMFDRFMRRRAEADHQSLFAFEREDQLLAEGSEGHVSLVKLQSVAGTALKRTMTASIEEAQRRDRKMQENKEKKKKLEGEIGDELIGSHISGLNRTMQELMGHYVLIEEYFLQVCVAKAIRLDRIEEGQNTSTMVDDVFFVIQKCTRRALSTQSLDSVCAALNHTTTIIESDYGSVLKKSLLIGVTDTFTNLFSGAGDLKDVLGQVQRKIETSSEGRFREYMVHLNNVQMSAKYIAKLQCDLTLEFNTLFAYLPERKRQKGINCLEDLSGTATAFNQMRMEALEKMHNYAIYPRVRSYCEDMAGGSYVLSDHDLSYGEGNNLSMHRLIGQLGELLLPFKEGLEESNFEAMTILVTNHLTGTLESVVMEMAFNQNGGLQLDKDLRLLIGFLSGLGQWSMRERFARLSQMATVLCLDKVNDMMEYYGDDNGSITWRLTPSEIRAVLALRADFQRSDINKLKL